MRAGIWAWIWAGDRCRNGGDEGKEQAAVWLGYERRYRQGMNLRDEGRKCRQGYGQGCRQGQGQGMDGWK